MVLLGELSIDIHQNHTQLWVDSRIVCHSIGWFSLHLFRLNAAMMFFVFFIFFFRWSFRGAGPWFSDAHTKGSLFPVFFWSGPQDLARHFEPVVVKCLSQLAVAQNIFVYHRKNSAWFEMLDELPPKKQKHMNNEWWIIKDGFRLGMTIVFTVSTADERYLCVMYIGLWLHARFLLELWTILPDRTWGSRACFYNKSQMMWI